WLDAGDGAGRCHARNGHRSDSQTRHTAHDRDRPDAAIAHGHGGFNGIDRWLYRLLVYVASGGGHILDARHRYSGVFRSDAGAQQTDRFWVYFVDGRVLSGIACERRNAGSWSRDHAGRGYFIGLHSDYEFLPYKIDVVPGRACFLRPSENRTCM